MQHRYRNSDRRKYGIYINMTPEETDVLNEVCDHLDISYGLFVSVAAEVAYERHILGNAEITADEIAERLGIGHGVVTDITGIY